VLSINENTNCRSGPGELYPVLLVLRAGQSVDIVGRSAEGNYWVVNRPDQSGTCWAWGEYATASGSIESVDRLAAPPTVTPSPPTAPRALLYNFVCSFNETTTNLTWTDAANNELGYRVLRNGQEIANLPANSNAYTDIAPSSVGRSFTYTVQAYNSGGVSPSSITFACP
jgi:uncharacterized protein YgiM (DUF1202 family)